GKADHWIDDCRLKIDDLQCARAFNLQSSIFNLQSIRIPGRMELFSAPDELDDFLRRSETVERDGPVRVTRPEEFRAEVIDSLVWTAVFGQPSVRDAARRAIHEAAGSVGILPASILPLYKARGRGEVSGFTAPAVNLRML